MSRVIVVARADGRGGIKPFGTFNKNHAGIDVFIHGKPYKVTKDGRVNIPKSVMEQGTKGKDGRYRIQIEFATEKARTGALKEVHTRVFKPDKHTKDKETGYKVKTERMEKQLHISEREYEFSWTPLK